MPAMYSKRRLRKTPKFGFVVNGEFALPGNVVILMQAMNENLPPNRIREWRLARGLTMEALAAAPGVNLTKGHIGNLERGKRELTKPVMERLARVFGCSEADLLNTVDGGLTPEERRIIETYRTASESGRNAIRAVADSQQPRPDAAESA